MKSATKVNRISLISIPVILGVIVLGFFVSQNMSSSVAYATEHEDSVDVVAFVDETVSCSSDLGSTDFGTLSTSNVATAPEVTTELSCNIGSGCVLNIQSAGDTTAAGLYKASTSTPTHLITSADETLSGGTEGYGIQASTATGGDGGTLTIAPAYAGKSGEEVGALQTTATQLATAGEPVTNRGVVVTHKAAISNLTPSGTYNDTITYSCIAQ